jgi:alpha-methylacyl-CoA racemase
LGEAPAPPLNTVGDFGVGEMFLARGVVAGDPRSEVQRPGPGGRHRAMVDGSAVLLTMLWSMKSTGIFDENSRGTHLLDTGAHFYDVYECSDGRYISIGSIERQFLCRADEPDRPRR